MGWFWIWFVLRDHLRGYEFRRTPVPRTGKGSPYRWLRHPRTTSERRASDAVDNDPEMREYKVKSRAKRSKAMLPSAWDDLPRHVDKSWKRHRKTQYRMKT